MPRVGNRSYPYSEKGMKAAKKAAHKSGMPMKMAGAKKPAAKKKARGR